MKKNGGFKYIFLMVIIAFSSSMIGYISGARAKSGETNEKKTLQINAPFAVKNEHSALSFEDSLPIIDTDSPVTSTYILKERSGKLALFSKFSDGKESLYQEYDISVDFLPKSDRELLSKGIEAQTLSDALQLIEDYSS